ncbi:hypothetical protein GE09DRAFT_546282 [Coniochaeta sp. 2T2.1]|nr:hypothetical protein GE09DRAFT_546282 [Coniochaeta sp. 2T2.1]
MSSKAVEATPAEQTDLSSTHEMASKATEPTSVQERRTGFLHLPIELRLMIYRLALPTRTLVNITEKPTFRGASYWVSGVHSHRLASKRHPTDTSEAHPPKVLQRMEEFPRQDRAAHHPEPAPDLALRPRGSTGRALRGEYLLPGPRPNGPIIQVLCIPRTSAPQRRKAPKNRPPHASGWRAHLLHGQRRADQGARGLPGRCPASAQDSAAAAGTVRPTLPARRGRSRPRVVLRVVAGSLGRECRMAAPVG